MKKKNIYFASCFANLSIFNSYLVIALKIISQIELKRRIQCRLFFVCIDIFSKPTVRPKNSILGLSSFSVPQMFIAISVGKCHVSVLNDDHSTNVVAMKAALRNIVRQTYNFVNE